MEILIVSRTRYGAQRCIGGIILENNRSVRLVQKDGSYWPSEVGLKVGGIYDIEFQPCASITPPFTENLIAVKGKHLRNVESVREFLITRASNLESISWRGSVDSLYEGKVRFQPSNSRAYISVGNEPSMSTGFWIPQNDLLLQPDKKHYRCTWQEIAYVGEEDPLELVPAGTLCRVSLAAPIKPHPDFEGPDRYYVQLSGWYL